MSTSPFDLSGRVAVITGGGGLLGYQHAAAIASVGGVSQGFGAAASHVLTAAGVGSTDAVLPMLFNELAVLPAPVTLVLDDYHLITNPHILRSTAFLVEHLPLVVRLALAARAAAARQWSSFAPERKPRCGRCSTGSRRVSRPSWRRA